MRFSGEIHYEKQIDESVLSVRMPAMILQPIVENCVNHGIHEMEGKGKIQLQVYRKEELVCISIRDNGKGINRESVEKILNGTYRNESNTGSSNGIGMDNVIARLKLYSEMEDVMRIYSDGNDLGTEVIIYLKKREEGGDLSCTGSCWRMMKGL